MTDFHVGQRVVCVDVSDLPSVPGRSVLPVHGAVYTVRAISEDPYFGILVLHLLELKNPASLWAASLEPYEPGFKVGRFRPVVELGADISMFTAIIDRVNKREVVDA